MNFSKDHIRSQRTGRKCRKVYGVNNRHEWCTACRWKKACRRFPSQLNQHHTPPLQANIIYIYWTPTLLLLLTHHQHQHTLMKMNKFNTLSNTDSVTYTHTDTHLFKLLGFLLYYYIRISHFHHIQHLLTRDDYLYLLGSVFLIYIIYKCARDKKNKNYICTNTAQFMNH